MRLYLHSTSYFLTLLVCGIATTLKMESIEQGREEKWKGKAIAEVKGVKAEEVWPLLEDFFGLNKWFPTPLCIPVEGLSGQPGCVRFCAGFKTPVDDETKKTVNWTKQKLLSIDPSQWTFTYSIVEGNVGFHSYIATWKLKPTPEGTEIQWHYEVEPVEGWKLEYLNTFTDKGLNAMAKKIEEGLKTMETALKFHN
uniref:Lachrymatory-factor synthase n=2 Tax=Phaseolus vulgaris TaxID=3885 RepID=V7C433_PHAVU|nr:hypothetical protein PHAVU_004G170100g [Phaseolus vulgaris]ESW24899.1 hypothetical protein PHAVU_004G170100g [Phaseolus vulgaris]